MKKTFPLVFVIIFLCISGCGINNRSNNEVMLFYPNRTITYGIENSAISGEARDGAFLSQENLIDLYLSGPNQKELYNPFPKSTKLISLKVEESEATLTLSNEYASLSGLSLSIANACLGKTVINLLDVKNVKILCESEFISGKDMFVITDHSLVLFDQSISNSNSVNTESVVPTQ